jgi:glycosyltransferase involved in cell wall biosynthesis
VSGIHQFVPMLHQGDAVGRHTRRLRETILARGIDSRIYVELVDPETSHLTELASTYADRSQLGDVLIYQFATASQLAGWLAGRSETLVVNYHNVTPADFFAAWDNPLARHQVRARAELAQLVERTTLAIAVSHHNELELREAGFTRTAVVPPAAMLATTPGGSPRELTTSGDSRWLTIGRLAPNKAIELALMALAVTRKHYDPGATLDIIGQSVVPSYTEALHRFTTDLGLGGAVRFRGHVTDDDLASAMDAASLLLITSQHEGFGVPIIEALSRGLPVVASRAGALPEILGDAGVLVDARNPYASAAAIAEISGDADWQTRNGDAAVLQLASLDLATAADRLVDQVVALRLEAKLSY